MCSWSEETVWLAPLQLVSVKDAVFNVLLYCALSAILDRLVLIVELGWHGKDGTLRRLGYDNFDDTLSHR